MKRFKLNPVSNYLSDIIYITDQYYGGTILLLFSSTWNKIRKLPYEQTKKSN